jgi:uncharacterized membrane protein YphA (DoxX/SURF4 family)
MDVTLFIARVLLATLFGFAGIAKLLDLKGSAKAMTDFGAPEWLAAPLGYSLPFIEIKARAMGLFGASGTPSALLVDRAGNIGSSLALGADAIFTSAGNRESAATN